MCEDFLFIIRRDTPWCVFTKAEIMTQTITPSKGLKGSVTVPGDKSISHRALMISALAGGNSVIEGVSAAADPVSTRQCLRALGVEIAEENGIVTVHGKGLRGLRSPAGVLDAGNSGTTMRLLAGMLVGQSFPSEITGDDSLRSRPMKRVIEPLSLMGANIQGSEESTAPLRIQPVSKLQSITYQMPLASAQVKSAILLAGLYAEGITTVVESIQTRDHTERMLGLEVQQEQGKQIVRVRGGMNIDGKKYVIPGDISAAAFLISAALLVPHSEIVIRNVGLNPTRTAVLDVFRQMGGRVELANRREVVGEPMGDIVAATSDLSTGFELKGERVAALIDEIPILAVTAVFARGLFVVRDAQELRVKESDRIKAIVLNLRAMGVEVEEYDDGFAFEGRTEIRGANLDSVGDHRIAMAFAVAGLRAREGVRIQGAECVEISFPRFWGTLKTLES